jgi:hypothetical protein
MESRSFCCHRWPPTTHNNDKAACALNGWKLIVTQLCLSIFYIYIQNAKCTLLLRRQNNNTKPNQRLTDCIPLKQPHDVCSLEILHYFISIRESIVFFVFSAFLYKWTFMLHMRLLWMQLLSSIKIFRGKKSI